MRGEMTSDTPILLKSVTPLPTLALGVGQPEYRILYVHRSSADANGMTTARFSLSWRERLKVLLGGNLWLQVLSFHQPFQPVKILVEEPSVEECL